MKLIEAKMASEKYPTATIIEVTDGWIITEHNVAGQVTNRRKITDGPSAREELLRLNEGKNESQEGA